MQKEKPLAVCVGAGGGIMMTGGYCFWKRKGEMIMYGLAYVAGMLLISLAAYGVVLVNRKNKQEALTLGATVFVVIAVLGIIKWFL